MNNKINFFNYKKGECCPSESHDDAIVSSLLYEIGVPDDLVETVLDNDTAPSEEILERIKKQTMNRIKKAGTGKGFIKNRPLKIKALVAAVLLMFSITVAWIGPAQVWAGVQNVLRLIPGIGLVLQEETLTTAGRIRHEIGGGYIEIAGFAAGRDGTSVSIDLYQFDRFTQLPFKEPYNLSMNIYHKYFKKIYLVDQDGREYRLEEGEEINAGYGPVNDSEGNELWEGWLNLELPPLGKNIRHVTMVVPLPDDSEVYIDISLIPLQEIEGKEQTVSNSGITISASASFGKETRISLGYVDPDYIDFHEATLFGKDGREYIFKSGYAGQKENNFEIFFEGVDPGEEVVTLKIDTVLLTEPGEDRITIPVPSKGTKIELNRVVNLGRSAFTLTGAETVNYLNNNYLHLFMDSGIPGQNNLFDFSIDRGHGLGYDEKTGNLSIIRVPLKENEHEVELIFNRPVYAVDGPWTFTFDVK